jgi:hypothetical protein
VAPRSTCRHPSYGSTVRPRNSSSP